MILYSNIIPILLLSAVFSLDSHSSACSIPLASRQALADAVAQATANTHETLQGSLVFSLVGEISNPSGTYGGHTFASQVLDADICDCLTSTCTRTSDPKFSNKDVETLCGKTFAPYPTTAVVTIGCMPPKPVDYFAFQTNVFSKYDTRPDKSPDTVYFPEVAPYAPISHLKLPDWGEPYVVVSTGSTELAQTITSALTDSGLQQSSVILDGLVHPAVDLADTELPDTLQVVVRMNSAEFGDELLQYIAESSTEQIALYLTPTIPAQQDFFTPLEATPLPKRKIEDDGSFELYSEKLDALTALIQKKFAGNGFVLSYSGIFDAAMDYGYSETDTDDCCLSGYFDNDEYWKPLMHFSTSDCLYRVHGGYANTGDNNNKFLVGEALSTDYSIIGESKNLSSYSSYFCDNSGLQLNYHCASSSCDDGSCSVISASMIPAMSGCEAVPADSLPVPLFVKFDCAVDGTPTETLYLDSNCKHQYGDQVNMTQCRESTTYVEGEVWAGGYMRETTVAVFIGVMTNEIGHSSFHNIYLPDFSTYNDPNATAEKNYNEDELKGSSSQFGDGFEEVFAAQFGRECLSDDPKYCKIIGEADLASGNLLDFMSRQYLDPTTGLGTDKDYLPGHRVLIFDKAN